MKDLKNLLQIGFEYLNAGDFNKAIKIGENILTKNSDDLDAHVLLGLSLFQKKDYDKSILHLETSLLKKPFDQVLIFYYLENLLINGDYHKGLEVIKRKESFVNTENLIKIKIEFYEKAGLHDLVVKEINCLKNQKYNLFKCEKLAWNYELLNQIHEANRSAKQGLKIDSRNFRCNSIRSKILLRKGQYKKALNYTKNIDKQHLSAINKSIFYALKAQIYEKLEKYNKAFNCYSKSNRQLKHTKAYKLRDKTSIYAYEKIELIDKYFEHKPKFKILKPAKEQITFLVGFPRSGTTLLENILNAHTEISTIEEKPTVDAILENILNSQTSLEKIESWTTKEINDLQQRYIQTRKEYNSSGKSIIVDKLPLNLIHVGLLYRIFPNAKFIISLRDIRDVALSCYFQNFQINAAMAYFLDWETTYKYLLKVFNTATKILKHYPIQFKIIEYEEIVEDPFGKVKDLISFLELDWQAGIYDYRKNIKGKNINTPSYSAVFKKINNKRKNRWLNYQTQTKNIDNNYVFKQIQELKHKF